MTRKFDGFVMSMSLLVSWNFPTFPTSLLTNPLTEFSLLGFVSFPSIFLFSVFVSFLNAFFEWKKVFWCRFEVVSVLTER